jgi:hypothetical protein
LLDFNFSAILPHFSLLLDLFIPLKREAIWFLARFSRVVENLFAISDIAPMFRIVIEHH